MNLSFSALGDFIPFVALFFLGMNGLLLFTIKRRFAAGRLNVTPIEYDTQIRKLERQFIVIGFGAAALVALCYIVRG